jgi:hypothetical protein
VEFVWRRESVVDPTVQRENLVAYVGTGMMTRHRAAEIMGETLPDDPMADVLTGLFLAVVERDQNDG